MSIEDEIFAYVQAQSIREAVSKAVSRSIVEQPPDALAFIADVLNAIAALRARAAVGIQKRFRSRSGRLIVLLRKQLAALPPGTAKTGTLIIS